jgi:hypothetical protein
MLRTTLFLAAALALSACASSGTTTASNAGGSRDCFRALDVKGYGIVDERRVRLRVSPQRQYILTITQHTRDLDYDHNIAVRSVTSFICVGDPSGVTLMGGDPPFPYQVTAIERAPAETTGS